jgi:pimeloyl-ACP methyl ester carboxylesterase
MRAPGPIARFFSRRTLLADRFLHGTPAAWGLEAREVEIEAADGVPLHGWWIEGRKEGAVVFCPGNSGNASQHLEYARITAGTGHAVLAFDYRGFGRSGGEADLRRVALDVEAACAFASARAGRPAGLFGISLGAAAALLAAARGRVAVAGVAAEGVHDVRRMLEGLLADGSFGPRRVRTLEGPDGPPRPREASRLVRRLAGRPVASWAAAAAAAFYPFAGKSPDRLARRLRATPVFIIHGVEDPLFPFEAALDLHRRLPGPRRLWLIPGTGHAQEPALTAGAEYARQLGSFFGAAFRGEDEPAAEGPVLWSVEDRGALRQWIAVRGDRAEPPAGALALPLLAPGGDAVADRYRRGGYQAVFRALARAGNERDLAGLERGLEAQLRLPRARPYDFLAAQYALRGAQAALGLAPEWPARDPAAARRTLESFLLLWLAHAELPGEDAPESPAAWARSALRGL